MEIDPVILGYIGLALMLLLAFCGVWLAYAMIGVSMVGITMITDLDYTFNQIGMLVWEKGADSVLMCIPLFILMGQLVYKTNIISDLFDCVRKWVGHLPGGLAIAAIMACAGFGAVTGSTIAATATMGATVMPELEKYGYNVQLSAATIAMSAGLAAIIPPSVGFILYGVLTDSSIAQLFMSGVIPGILLAMGYSAYVVVRCILNPALGPRGESYSLGVRFRGLVGVIPVTALFILVIGGIYGGIFTPTEAAGIGVSGTIAIALCMRRLTLTVFRNAVYDSCLLSVRIFLIVFAGYLLSRFLVLAGTTEHLIDAVIGQDMGQWTFALLVAIIYIVLGCVLDSFGLVILTVPLLVPMALAVGFDVIWFGGYVTLLICMGTVTPPIGINVYVLHGVLPEIPSGIIFRGVIPFCLVHCAITLLCLVWPELIMWLPMTM